MMATAKEEQPGLSRMAVTSLALHLVLLVGFAFFTQAPVKRIFYAPVISVNLVSPPGAAGPRVVAKEEKQPAVRAVEEKKAKVKEEKKEVAKEAKREVPVAPAKQSKSSVKEVVETKGEEKAVTVAKNLDIKEGVVKEPSKEALQAAKAREAEQKRREEIQEKERQRQEWVAAQRERERQWLVAQQERERQVKQQELKKVAPAATEPGPSKLTGQYPTAVTGTGGAVRGEIYDIKFKAYLNAVRERVREKWTVPEIFSKNFKLTTIVAVRINRDGTLSMTRVEEASGNPRYDETVLRAVAKAAPLPPLPEDYKGDYMELGFRFRPEGID